jgi:hypothetical protein
MNTVRLFLILLLVAIAPSPESGAQNPPRPPAATLRPAAAGVKAPNADGFIQRWLLLEPIRTNAQLTDNAVQAAVKTDYFPNQFAVIPRDGDAVTVAGAELRWHAEDTIGYNKPGSQRTVTAIGGNVGRRNVVRDGALLVLLPFESVVAWQRKCSFRMLEAS